MPPMVPMETTLYRRVAKDYSPKKAAMMICEYIEGLEARIIALEARQDEPPAATPNPITQGQTAPTGRGRKPTAQVAIPDEAKEE